MNHLEGTKKGCSSLKASQLNDLLSRAKALTKNYRKNWPYLCGKSLVLGNQALT